MGVSRVVVGRSVVDAPTGPTLQAPPPNPIVILDWDDTILPNTHLARLGFVDERCALALTQEDERQLHELESHVTAFLAACAKLGTCYVVTNGLDGWVERSCARFLPAALPLIATMTIVSARATFEKRHPNRPVEWKIAAFTDLLAKHETLLAPAGLPLDNNRLRRSPQQILALGDSPIDRCAVQYVARRTPNVQLKSVKLIENPTMRQLAKQLAMLTGYLPQLGQHNEALDLELSPRMLQ